MSKEGIIEKKKKKKKKKKKQKTEKGKGKKKQEDEPQDCVASQEESSAEPNGATHLRAHLHLVKTSRAMGDLVLGVVVAIIISTALSVRHLSLGIRRKEGRKEGSLVVTASNIISTMKEHKAVMTMRIQ